jgi:hypothetical protein
MKQLEKKLYITYRWWRPNEEEIKPEHVEALEESAMERINDQMSEGMSSGELHDNILMNDDDGDDGITYQGWWDLTVEEN